MTRNAIISDKQLGDVTLLEPLSRLLAMRDGEPVAMRVKESFAPLVKLMPHAQVYSKQMGRMDSSWTTSWGSRACRESFRLRARRKTLFINQSSRLRWWHRLVFSEVIKRSMSYEYWALYFWKAAGGETVDFQPPKLLHPPDSWRHPDLPEGDYCLINPTAAWKNKFWLPERWIQFLEDGGLPETSPVVLTGGFSEFEMQHCEAIVKGCRRPLISLAGRTDMQQFLHALSRARLVSCVDGSASHLAQAFGLPVLTLFGPSYHSLWHWPSPIHLRVSACEKETSEQAPMSEITVDRVITKSQKLWQ